MVFSCHNFVGSGLLFSSSLVSGSYSNVDEAAMLQNSAFSRKVSTLDNSDGCAGPTLTPQIVDHPYPFPSTHPCGQGLFVDMPDGSIRSYNLEIKLDDLQFLNSDPTAEEYVPCNVEVNYGSNITSKITGAQCRYKGNLGSFYYCTETIQPPTGAKLNQSSFGCRKMGLKVKLKGSENKEAAKGLKKFQFLGLNRDDSLARLKLATAVLNQAGIVASCAVPSNVYINGQYEGIHDFVEQVDDVFTEKRFGDDEHQGNGALYKNTWPFSPNVSDYPMGDDLEEDVKGEDYNYIFARLNQDATEFVEGCKSKECTADQAGAILDKYVHAQSFIDAFVGIAMTSNWDQVLTAMTGLGGGKAHNQYTYVKDEKLYYISWDFTEVFNGPTPSGGNGHYFDANGVPGDRASRHVNVAPGSPVFTEQAHYMPFPWYHVPSEEERSWACAKESGENSFHPWMQVFTCNPVNELMARAWETRFLERFLELSKGAVKRAKAIVKRWKQQSLSAVQCGALNGDSPSLKNFMKDQKPVIGHMRSAVKLWRKIAKYDRKGKSWRSVWPIHCDIDPSKEWHCSWPGPFADKCASYHCGPK